MNKSDRGDSGLWMEERQGVLADYVGSVSVGMIAVIVEGVDLGERGDGYGGAQSEDGGRVGWKLEGHLVVVFSAPFFDLLLPTTLSDSPRIVLAFFDLLGLILSSYNHSHVTEHTRFAQ